MRIIGWKGADLRTSRNFYKAVVQSTLLFSAEIWFMSPRIGKTLGGFHHRVACRMTGMRLSRDTAGRWVYPHLDVAIISVGLEEV